MKTRYEWEEEDMQSGRYIIRQSSPLGSTNISFATSVTYKLGFISSHKRTCRISICDGMIVEMGDRHEAMKKLNEDDFGYRPLTQGELENQIDYLQMQNEGKA